MQSLPGEAAILGARDLDGFWNTGSIGASITRIGFLCRALKKGPIRVTIT